MLDYETQLLVAKQYQLRAAYYEQRITTKSYLERVGHVFKGGLPENGGIPCTEQEILEREMQTFHSHIKLAQDAIETLYGLQWHELRKQWALKAPAPSTTELEAAAAHDRALNQHNDVGWNKPPRRSQAEIISDKAYDFADAVLTQQYGKEYTQWLEDNTSIVHGRRCTVTKTR